MCHWFARRWYEEVHQVRSDYDWIDEDAVASWQHVSSQLREEEDTHKREYANLPPVTLAIDPEFEEEGKKHALLIAMYDDFIFDEELYENHVMVVLNGTEVVYFGENDHDHGMVPYIVAPYKRLPNSIYGESAIKHAIPHAEIIDKATADILRSGSWGSAPVFTYLTRDRAFRNRSTIQISPNRS